MLRLLGDYFRPYSSAYEEAATFWYGKAAVSNRSQAGINSRSRWAPPLARHGSGLIPYARVIVLGPRLVIVEEAAATGKALTFVCALSLPDRLSRCVGASSGRSVGSPRACEKASDEGDLEESAVNRVAKSGAPGSSSIGSSP